MNEDEYRKNGDMYYVRQWIFLAIVMYAIFFLAFCSPARAEKEQQTIARVIAAEACGEGERGMIMVAQVIASRARAWGKTPYQIVTAKNQFFGLTAKNSNRLYQDCQSVADRLATLIFTWQTGQNLTGGALYFRQPGEKRMPWHKTETVRYKNHIFYK